MNLGYKAVSVSPQPGSETWENRKNEKQDFDEDDFFQFKRPAHRGRNLGGCMT